MPVTDYYLTTDAMGSVTAILDEDGNVLERRSYDAFGEMTCMTPDGTPVAEGPTGVDVGFQGQIRDNVIDLCQMGFRWYNPALGRWMSRDPIGLLGGVNLCSFVINNPMKWDDSMGLLVDGVYDKKTGKLTITDRETGVSKTIDVESGGKPFGDPIPDGKYDILQQERKPEEFRLDKQDSSPYDDIDDVTGRTHFRLHKPGRTIGCIAALKPEEWRPVHELICKTETTTVPDNFCPWWKFWGKFSGPPGRIKNYGQLTVK
jgi:RHS repeat-associated protein